MKKQLTIEAVVYVTFKQLKVLQPANLASFWKSISQFAVMMIKPEDWLTGLRPVQVMCHNNDGQTVDRSSSDGAYN